MDVVSFPAGCFIIRFITFRRVQPDVWSRAVRGCKRRWRRERSRGHVEISASVIDSVDQKVRDSHRMQDGVWFCQCHESRKSVFDQVWVLAGLKVTTVTQGNHVWEILMDSVRFKSGWTMITEEIYLFPVTTYIATWCHRLSAVVTSPWMYNNIWIQPIWQAPIHSYESCSVVHDVPDLKILCSE